MNIVFRNRVVFDEDARPGELTVRLVELLEESVGREGQRLARVLVPADAPLGDEDQPAVGQTVFGATLEPLPVGLKRMVVQRFAHALGPQHDVAVGVGGEGAMVLGVF